MKNKHHILEQFSQFLDEVPSESTDPGSDTSANTGANTDSQTEDTTDLLSLFQVLYVLKNEVKIESRQVKTALDEFKGVFGVLNDNQSYLQRTIDSQQQQLNQQLEQQHQRLLKPLLLALIELSDRLSRSIDAAVVAPPFGGLARLKHTMAQRLWPKTAQKLQTIVKGQQITLRQLQSVLATHQVDAIPCIDQPYDPTLMKVVATGSDLNKANNTVLDDQLTGYLWQGRLLRLAEVSVNKHIQNAGRTATKAAKAEHKQVKET